MGKYSVVILDDDGNVTRIVQSGLSFHEATELRDRTRDLNVRFDRRHLVQIEYNGETGNHRLTN